SRRIGEQGDVRVRGRGPLDPVDEVLHHGASEAAALMVGVGGDVGEVEVPGAVAEGATHRGEAAVGGADRGPGPAVLERADRLLRGAGAEPRDLAQTDVLLAPRCGVLQAVSVRECGRAGGAGGGAVGVAIGHGAILPGPTAILGAWPTPPLPCPTMPAAPAGAVTCSAPAAGPCCAANVVPRPPRR